MLYIFLIFIFIFFFFQAEDGIRHKLVTGVQTCALPICEEISADEAERAGLVNRVFADEDFEESVERYVAAFERVSRTAVVLTKRLLYQMDGLRDRKSVV